MTAAPAQEARFTEIDLLRFVAALAVMLLHYGVRPYADHLSPLHFPVLGPLVKYNYLGVNLFFMISGFVILMTAWRKDLRGFIVSRIVRLYPAYWVCCTLTFAVILLLARDLIYTSLPRYLLNMTMLNGFVNIGGIDGPYWTLCIELKFYLLVGVLLALRQLREIEYYLGAWLALSALHLAWQNPALSYVLIPEYSAYFIAGAVFYLIHRDGCSRYRAILLVASFAVGMANDAVTLIEKSYWYHMEFSVATLGAITLAFYLVFALISVRPKGRGRWDRVFVFLGTTSYPLYLLHNSIGIAIFNRLAPYVDRHVLLIGTGIAMIGLARVIHVQVEKRYSPALKRTLESRVLQWRRKVEPVGGVMKPADHIGILDGWRGVSILLVLAAHLLPLGSKDWQLNFAAGVLGMVIFFTLSGFLITSFLLRETAIREFLARRFFRIVPLAWLYLTLALLASGARPDTWFAHFLFYANLPPKHLVPLTDHLWSVCLEVQFYLGIAALAAAFGARGLLALPALCVVFTMARILNVAYASTITYFRFDEILAGCTLALVYHGRLGTGLVRLIRMAPQWPLLLLVALSSLLQAEWLNYLRPYLAAILIGATVLNGRTSLGTVLGTRMFAYLAGISYALYVIHPLLAASWLGSGDVIEKYAKRPLLFAVLFVLAHLSTYYYERRWIAFGKRLAAGWSPPLRQSERV